MKFCIQDEIRRGIGKSERWVMDRTGQSSSMLLNRYYRKEQWEYGDLTPLVEAVPALGDGEEQSDVRGPLREG